MASKIIIGALGGLVLGAAVDPEGGIAVVLTFLGGLAGWAWARSSRAPRRQRTSSATSGAPRPGSSRVFAALREAVRRGDLDREAYVWLVREAEAHVRGLLHEWWKLGKIDEDAYVRLDGEMGPETFRREATEPPPEPAPAARVVTEAPTLPAPAPPEAPVRPATVPPAAAPPPPQTAAPQAPGRLAQMLAALRSDVALHGLAYLGVLLMFAGTAGLVIFAFAEVRPALRPVAEAAIPLSLFAAAWFLARRGIRVASGGLQVLGATLLPLVIFASFVDDAPVPPDLEGAPLLAALVLTSVGLAGGYRWVAARRPDSIFSFMVAPMLWVAAGMTALAWRGEHVAGVGIRSISTDQMAAAMVMVVLTLSWVSIRRDSELRRPVQAVAAVASLGIYIMGLLAAAAAGWPVWPMVVLGVATMGAVELAAPRLHRSVASLVQLVVAGVTLGALAPAWGQAWTGATAALVYLVFLEWQALRRPDERVKALGLAGVAIGLLASVERPEAALIAFGGASLWAHARRPTAEGDERRVLAVAATVAPAGFLYGLLSITRPGPALMALGGAAAIGAAILRVRRVEDRFWGWWLPLAGASVAVLTAMPFPNLSPDAAGAAAASAALGLALAPAPGVARVWLASASLGWALTLVMRAMGAPSHLWPAGWSADGLIGVLSASMRKSPAADHLGTAGHLATLGALLAARPGTAGLTVALTGWTSAWLAAVVAQERGGSSLVGALVRVLRRIFLPRWERFAVLIPGLMLVASGPFFVVELGDTIGVLEGRRAWAGLALTATALLYGAVARSLVRRRPLAPILAAGAVLTAAVAVAVTAPDRGPMIAASSAAVAVVALIGGRLRKPAMTWFGWAMTGTVALVGASLMGVPGSSLHVVLMGWGAALLVGGLGYDDVRSGRRAPGEGLRTPWIGHLISVGALAVPVGLAFTFGGPTPTMGRWALVAAGVYVLGALQLRAGAVVGVAFALAAFGAGALSPISPLDRPEVLVPIAAVAAGAALLLSRADGPRDLWLRWDVPPLVVAHGIGAVALARTAASGSVPVTWLGFALLSLVVAAWLRRWPWAAGAGVLTIVGAAAAGPEWLALALLAVAAGCAFAASRMSDPRIRAAIHASSVVAAGLAWMSFLRWVGWSASEAVVATALVSGGVGLAVATSVRRTGAPRDWVAAWGTLAVVGLAASWTGFSVLGDTAGALGMAGGMAMLAAASGLAARPTGWGWMREASVGLLLGSAGFAGLGLRLGVEAQVMAAVGAGLAGTVTLVLMGRLREGSPWLRPIVLFGVAAVGASIALAAGAWPRRDLMVLAIMVAGAEAAATGLVLRRTEPLLLSPLLLCAGYLLFAEQSLRGDPHWFTVPIGLTLLVTIELARGTGAVRTDASAGRREEDAWSGVALEREIAIAVEYLGMATFVGLAMIETVTNSVAFGLLGVTLGALLTVWGIATRVRRRAAFGAGVVILSSLLMLGVPLAGLIPTFTGAALWIAVAALGTLFVLVATLLEQGRARVRSAARRLGGLMEGWE